MANRTTLESIARIPALVLACALLTACPPDKNQSKRQDDDAADEPAKTEPKEGTETS